MVKTIKGNILEATRGIIVHGCNATDGPVGGLAKAVFEMYPEAQELHNKAVRDAYLDPMGGITYYKVSDELYIVNAITQRLPGSGTLSYDAVFSCFKWIDALAYNTGLPILYPKIGAGIAGGNWNIINTIVKETIGDHKRILYVL